MITIGNDLTIFNAWGEPKMQLDIPNDFKQANELMSEHYVQFSFPLTIKYDFVRADYIDYKGIRYAIRTDCQPTENGLHNYRYEPKFEAPEMFWQDFICWYIYQGLKEAEWTLMEHAGTFLQIGCDNINAYTGETWTVGIVEPTDMQNLTFSSQNVFDMLTDVAEAFNCEWYLDYEAKTINLVYSYSKGEPMELRREIELIDIKRSNENSDEYCTRMYAFGGTRNIPSNYRSTGSSEVVDAIVQKRLRLPISNGDYIDAFPNMTGNKIIEKVFTFDNIYPKRTGTITSLRTATVKNEEGKEMTVFYFKDSCLNFSSEYILPGLTLSLQFGENSFLSGRDFELGYNVTTEEFEIINNQDNPDLIIPNDLLCPRVGDFYVLYNFNISLVGDQYVGEAEQELLIEAQAKMASLQEENATYTCMANPFRVAAYGLDLGLGQSVKLKSLIFNGGEKVSRIRGFTKYPVTCKDEYLVGEKPRYSRRKALEAKVDSNKKEADVNYLEAMRASNNNTRSIRGMNYLRTALQNETIIDKGLLLTTLIRLGAVIGGEWIEKAGINGAAVNPDDVVAYFGGSLDDAIAGLASIIFRMDGSGQLAKGNIIWDAGGNPTFNGVVTSTDGEGSSFIMDAGNKAIEIYARSFSSSYRIGRLMWEESTDTDNVIYTPKLILTDLYRNKISGAIDITKVSTCEVTPKGISFSNLSGGKTLIINNEIPTTSDLAPTGTIWSDGGNLKIIE